MTPVDTAYIWQKPLMELTTGEFFAIAVALTLLIVMFLIIINIFRFRS